ncbi:hypothetical protein [Streptomyces sp. XD-27]|uniref:hypothetical protein n=1 Tax=Streptomyces sp. XD-27 TaxID=3062779 RepID=UPI0026F46377|nr:hypothetical protein [Streptomyces sp. XD-27]WKX72456.1 hypothetical protein Q3Y56_23410 [Streptomyces sp. XD-27]
MRVLMQRHGELCARAVDPLEIAAGLEAHGVTDRTAARFRHRDVFSLAEELYARVPRAEEYAARGRLTPAPEPAPPAPRAPARIGARAGALALCLTPGALCAATVAAVHSTDAQTAHAARWGIGGGGAALVAVALALCLRRGPLRGHGPVRVTGLLCTAWLVAYALFGGPLLAEALHGGPGTRWPPAVPAPASDAAPTAVGLALAVLPALWCARWFAVRVRRRLVTAHTLEEFAGRVRPLLAGTAGLFLCALPPLFAAARLAFPGPAYGAAPMAAAVALSGLLFLARLLAAHGRATAAVIGPAAACAVEVASLCTVFAARLPGCGALRDPVECAVTAYGPAAVPAVACALAALGLLGHALVVLGRASSYSAPPRGTAPDAAAYGVSTRNAAPYDVPARNAAAYDDPAPGAAPYHVLAPGAAPYDIPSYGGPPNGAAPSAAPAPRAPGHRAPGRPGRLWTAPPPIRPAPEAPS